MKQLISLSALVVLVYLSCTAVYGANSAIMPLSEIKPGMEGEGKTIFKGTQIETFKFKVLGIIEKFSARKDLIIVELDSPVLAEAGIIAGMSGSPVYIDGKIIGAISYGFAFSKRPIGGVTPIEDIIKTDEYNTESPSAKIDTSNIKVEFETETANNIKNLLQQELSRRLAASPDGSLTPIKLIGISKNLDPSSLSLLSPMFSMAGKMKKNSITGSNKEKNSERNREYTDDPMPNRPKRIIPDKKLMASANLFEMAPADAVAIPLMRGDYEFSSSGTVTYVDGNKVFLFGHPFFNLGSVNFPMHKAEVITVVPSYQESFKMAATGNMAGTIKQDRFSAVQGVLGEFPYMIPMKVFLKNRNLTFNLEMVDNPLLTPILSSIGMANILIAQNKDFGFQSLEVKGKIFIENERNVIIEDLFSGPSAPAELSDLLLMMNFFLMNNPDKTIKIQKMDFEITVNETPKNARIENVMVNKTAFSPGELISVTLSLKNERGKSISDTLEIKAPKLKPGTDFYLMVTDKNQITRFEFENAKVDYFPEKLGMLIRSINNLRKNNRIYLRLMTTDQGVFIKGHEYADLPDSLKNVFSYNTKTDNQANITYSTLGEYQYEVPAVVSGYKIFKLKIKEERSDAQ